MIEEGQEPALRAEKFWETIQTSDPLPVYWDHPYLKECFRRHTDGKWYFEYVRDKYFGGLPAKRALSVGCGAGEVDRDAFELGVFSHLTGYDFSTGGVEVSRKMAAEIGMPSEYRRVDFNLEPFPTDARFDLVYDYATSHHVEKLEGLIKEIERVLDDDGIFVLYGYCGPARMQWTPQVTELANELLMRMPLRLRPMGELHRATIWEYMSGDPSEGVRGPDVVDVARAFFDVVEEINLGATLTHPMFSNNLCAFDPDNGDEQALFRLVCQYEQVLIANKIITSDVRLLVCRRRRHDPFRPERDRAGAQSA